MYTYKYINVRYLYIIIHHVGRSLSFSVSIARPANAIWFIENNYNKCATYIQIKCTTIDRSDQY